jgi:hypothetical protein
LLEALLAALADCIEGHELIYGGKLASFTEINISIGISSEPIVIAVFLTTWIPQLGSDVLALRELGKNWHIEGLVWLSGHS